MRKTFGSSLVVVWIVVIEEYIAAFCLLAERQDLKTSTLSTLLLLFGGWFSTAVWLILMASAASAGLLLTRLARVWRFALAFPACFFFAVACMRPIYQIVVSRYADGPSYPRWFIGQDQSLWIIVGLAVIISLFNVLIFDGGKHE